MFEVGPLTVAIVLWIGRIAMINAVRYKPVVKGITIIEG